MAANGPTVHLGPKSLVPGNGPLSQIFLKASGSGAGLPLLDSDTAGYTAIFKVPVGSTLTTGLVFRTFVVDDGANAADLGKGVVLGITVKKIADNTDSLDLSTGAATEATGTVTLASTSGVVRVTDIAIANASLDSIGAGDNLLLRVRRVGTNASDTTPGTAILLGLDVDAN